VQKWLNLASEFLEFGSKRGGCCPKIKKGSRSCRGLKLFLTEILALRSNRFKRQIGLTGRDVRKVASQELVRGLVEKYGTNSVPSDKMPDTYCGESQLRARIAARGKRWK
jgi:hypothetical protein